MDKGDRGGNRAVSLRGVASGEKDPAAGVVE